MEERERNREQKRGVVRFLGVSAIIIIIVYSAVLCCRYRSSSVRAVCVVALSGIRVAAFSLVLC